MHSKRTIMLMTLAFAALGTLPSATATLSVQSVVVQACVAVNCTEIHDEAHVKNCAASGNVILMVGDNNNATVCDQGGNSTSGGR